VFTAKLRLAGVGSTFPAASLARTSKVCAPSASLAVVWGEEHGANEALSTRHSKLDPGSLDENSNVGVLFVVVAPAAGPAVIVVSGGVVSGAPSPPS
jgi:hypothetical protein